MYRITGPAINLRYIATEIKLDTPLSEESTYIIKVAEFGIKYGYLELWKHLILVSLLIIVTVNFI